jgi:YggT family protein
MIWLIKKISNFLIGIILVLIVIRFILKSLGADTQVAFVSFIYEITQPLLTPFTIVFPAPSVVGGYALEFSALFALFVYAFIGYLIQEILEIIK